MASLQEQITAISERIREAEELRVDRAALFEKGLKERYSKVEMAEWAGMTHSAVVQSVKVHGTGSDKAKQVQAARRARARAAKKAA